MEKKHNVSNVKNVFQIKVTKNQARIP